MSETHKQVIVLRTDLNMRKGKMVAQGAHASMKALLDIMYPAEGIIFKSTVAGHTSIEHFSGDYKVLKMRDDIRPWLEGRFTKICVGVGSEAELLEIHQKAKEANLLTSLIQDAGLTEFGGVPTYTAVAVGPGLSEKIDLITGNLKLL